MTWRNCKTCLRISCQLHILVLFVTSRGIFFTTSEGQLWSCVLNIYDSYHWITTVISITYHDLLFFVTHHRSVHPRRSVFYAVLFTVTRREMAPRLSRQDTWRIRAVGTWRLRLYKVRTHIRHPRVRLSQSPTQLMRTDSAHKAHICRWRRLYLTRSSNRWTWSPEHSQAQAQTWAYMRNKGITDNNIDTDLNLFPACGDPTIWSNSLDSFLVYFTTSFQLYTLCSVERKKHYLSDEFERIWKLP